MSNLKTSLLLVVTLLLPVIASGQTTKFSMDSSTAFYQGETLDYVIYPPAEFKMVTDEAKLDGYSFAFVPDSQEYAKSDITIGVNIYKIRGIKFKQILKQDTVQMRKHYGKNLSINKVDSVMNRTGHELTTFYIDDETRFLPNVLMSYFDGGTEVVIFELLISGKAIRPEAEDIFIDCIAHFKALTHGTLGMR